jgi:hypothetical protein
VSMHLSRWLGCSHCWAPVPWCAVHSVSCQRWPFRSSCMAVMPKCSACVCRKKCRQCLAAHVQIGLWSTDNKTGEQCVQSVSLSTAVDICCIGANETPLYCVELCWLCMLEPGVCAAVYRCCSCGVGSRWCLLWLCRRCQSSFSVDFSVLRDTDVPQSHCRFCQQNLHSYGDGCTVVVWMRV